MSQQSIEIEKQNILEHYPSKMIELQQIFDSLKVQHDSCLKVTNVNILKLQGRIQHLSANPELAQFNKEAKELNTLLAQHQIVFFHKLAFIHDQCKTIESFGNQIFDIKTILRR